MPRDKQTQAKINAHFADMVKQCHAKGVEPRCPHNEDPRFVECDRCIEQLLNPPVSKKPIRKKRTFRRSA